MIVNMNGGLNGATLTVKAPVGASVTVSKDGKSKNRIADSDGVAVFKGLSSGEWTISITDGENTAHKKISITTEYSAEITFFAATIHISFPGGMNCYATDGTTILSAPDNSGIWDCIVPNAGTWDIYLNNEKANEIDITENGEEVTLNEWPLYYGGFDNVALTGGLTGDGYENGSEWEVGSDYISIYANGFVAAFGTTKKISMKNVKTVSAAVTIGQIKSEGYLTVGSDKDNGDIASAAIDGSGPMIVSADVPSNADDGYIIIVATSGLDITVHGIMIECS